MPRAPKNETYEQKRMRLMNAGYKQASTRRQNRDADGNLTATEDDLWEQAARYADRRLEADEKQTDLKNTKQRKAELEDLQYRDQQEKKYRTDYEWNSSNDEASLEHLLDLEIQVRQINRELEEGDVSSIEKQRLRKNLVETVKERRALETALAIDRVTREKRASTGDPMDEWDKIKEEAAIKKQQQRDRLLSDDPKEHIALATSRTEAELRDKMKVGLLINFEIVDAILTNHRRVLGLPLEVQKS